MNGCFAGYEENCVYICFNIMGKIYLKNIRLYAFHGCMDEEEKIGSDYVVNVVVDTNLDQSSKSDQLKDTVDYVALHSIVKSEMEQRAKLLEHVADRILIRIMKEHPSVEKAKVKVSKRNPTNRGKCRRSCCKERTTKICIKI
jgi:dihydroneopterin aldolase